MNYIGEKCFCCNKVFEKSDDVVVCPECGTPYHRECYKENGRCINEPLHESGQGWQRTILHDDEKINGANTNTDPNVKNDDDSIVCRHCFCKNDIKNEQCINCGMPLKKSVADNSAGSRTDSNMNQFFSEFDSTQKYFGFNQDEDFDGARLEEVAEFVNTNTIYYIPLFKRMKDIGSKISFNLVCFFFPQYYFANRKMWFMAIFALLFSIITKVPAFINEVPAYIDSLIYSYQNVGYEQLDYAMLNNIYESTSSFIERNQQLIRSADSFCTILNYAFKLVMCLFGNWYYYKFAVKSIKRIKTRRNLVQINDVLKSSGGTSVANIVITVLLGFAAYVGVMLAFCTICNVI